MEPLIIGMAVMLGAGLWCNGYAAGKDHGKWLATPTPVIPVQKLSDDEIAAAVRHDEWLEAQSPYCSVGGTNLEHEVMGACPCV